MVCNRCVMAVENVFNQAEVKLKTITLGEVTLAEENLSAEKLKLIDESLSQLGFERIDDKKARTIEAIKNIVVKKIHHTDKVSLKVNWSTLLADELHYDYNYLSNLFSSVEGITLEQYIIKQKIEKVKELLFYDELNLSEIAHQLGYSSVAHLSAQFKKLTGLTPSELKKTRKPDQARKPLDSII